MRLYPSPQQTRGNIINNLLPRAICGRVHKKCGDFDLNELQTKTKTHQN